MKNEEKFSQIKCLGFIMDGNRRWAKKQGLLTLEGHKRGMEVFIDSIKWVCEAGISNVVYYAFSTENWKRGETEVAYLINLFREIMTRFDETVRVRVVGRRSDFAPDLIEQINDLEDKSAKVTDVQTTIWIALSYGGRAEIAAAVNQAIQKGQFVTEESFASLLWTADLPDPDLIVRTSGEQRLSNFLTWKAVYSELLFIDKYWPALTKADFKDIIRVYESRERRTGK